MTQDTSLPELLRIPAEPEQPQVFTIPVDELDDEDFAPPPPRGKASKFTVLLTGLVVLALGFLGGALVQKHEGTSGTTTAAARAGRLRTALGAGGFGTGAGGFAGFGEGAGTAGAGTGAAAGGAGAAAAPGPVAIGTVVSITGNTLVVKDLGGKLHTLTLGSGVTLSTTSPLTATALKPGQTVTVDGTTDTSGTVTVTTVVRRSS
jgi:hypothetical protein